MKAVISAFGTFCFLSAHLLGCDNSVLAADAPWSTYRGNARRTAATDETPGPAAPKVLWVFKAQEQFIAAPVPAGDGVLVSGLGAFNVSTMYCLASDPKAAKRTLWTKTTPLLKLPIVSSPAVAGGQLVFGDGMHQTDRGHLHCLRVGDGLPRWQLAVPGRLVHLEGAPTIANGHVYTGAGAAGVICLDLQHVSLDGREMAADAVGEILDQKWKQLLAQYELDKKADPDFAVPPSDDLLPRAAPRLLWRKGQGEWHVDAPVAVVDNRVLAASARLEKEGVGERALFCLHGETGAVQWRAPLKVNPWGGPAISGEMVVIAGSSIGYEPKRLQEARGDIAAFQLADGKQRWRREIAGGVLACAALAGGLAVVTSTDGKVRAFNLDGGETRWEYDGRAPFFAAPAIAAGVVYAGDLKGVIHAIALDSGRALWTLDLATHPASKAPGMTYGGPVIHGGRLFVATCNVDGPHVGQPTVVVCIGAE